MTKVNPKCLSYKICLALSNAGREAYEVGGAVRDRKLGLIPKDIDIATNAKPEEVTKIFEELGYKVIPIGKRFGTVQIQDILDDEIIEVTTYRSESKYTDRRHPDKITFVESLLEDLARRDFRMNAIAFDPLTGAYIDPYNGITDIQNYIIQTVGDPDERFQEDPLRMVRAVRMEAKTSFAIKYETLRAIRENVHLISTIPIERVTEELVKILNEPYVKMAINTLYETGLMKEIIPQLHEVYLVEQPGKYHIYAVGPHSIFAVKCAQEMNVGITNPDPYFTVAIALHDVGKKKMNPESPYFPKHEIDALPILDEIYEKLKFPMEKRKYITFLVRHHMDCYHVMNNKYTDRTIRKYLSKIKHPEWLFDLEKLNTADMMATGKEHKEDLCKLKTWYLNVFRVMMTKPPVKIKDLKINGRDIIKTGVPAGPIIGRIQKDLLKMVIKSPVKNEREMLLKAVKVLWNDYKERMEKRNKGGVNICHME